MKKGDLIWIGIIGFIIIILIVPETHYMFVSMTKSNPYTMGFIKVSILATLGELFALRIVNNCWNISNGLIYRAIIWGILGMSFVLVFEVFAAGVINALNKKLLPGSIDSKLVFAFFTSMIMNITFAPTMMAFHRITDTIIDLGNGQINSILNVNIKRAIDTIDWGHFVSFVVIRTIPFFWIPAHTLTFLLPSEYRVLAAAFLSIALGAILAFTKKHRKHLS